MRLVIGDLVQRVDERVVHRLDGEHHQFLRGHVDAFAQVLDEVFARQQGFRLVIHVVSGELDVAAHERGDQREDEHERREVGEREHLVAGQDPSTIVPRYAAALLTEKSSPDSLITVSNGRAVAATVREVAI